MLQQIVIRWFLHGVFFYFKFYAEENNTNQKYLNFQFLIRFLKPYCLIIAIRPANSALKTDGTVSPAV